MLFPVVTQHVANDKNYRKHEQGTVCKQAFFDTSNESSNQCLTAYRYVAYATKKKHTAWSSCKRIVSKQNIAVARSLSTYETASVLVQIYASTLCRERFE